MDLDGQIDKHWLFSHKSLILATRNGLGDHIVSSGLAIWMSRNVDRLYIPCKEGYWQSVAWMYRNHPNIIPIGLDSTSNWETLENISKATGSQLCRSILGYQLRNSEPWITACYSQYKLPYYTRFKLSPHIEPGPLSEYVYDKVVKQPNYIVVHASSSTNKEYPIDIVSGRNPQTHDNYQVIHVDPNVSENIWDWHKVLVNAKEIHVVDSAIYRMCEQISDSLNGQVFFHYLRAVDYIPVFERDVKPYFPGWTWVDYPGLIWG